MRALGLKVRTALAVVATAFLLYEMPALFAPMTQPRDGLLTSPRGTVMVRVWLCESWTGTAMRWLTEQALLFEKAHKEARVVLRRAQRGDWFLPGAIPPDLLLFDKGAVSDPSGLFAPLMLDIGIAEPLASAGAWRGQLFAVPLSYGGNVRLTNPSKRDGITRTMKSEQDFQEFAAGKAIALVATVREARRMQALVDAEKGFPFEAVPFGNATDMLLLAGVFPNTGERARLSEAFVLWLLSADAQNALPELGLLPAASAALPPDPESQPLLYALKKEILHAANAFD